MTLGYRLRQLREGKGLMQREVGAWVEVDGAMISKVENGDKRINRDHLPILSAKFNVTLSELQNLWLADKVRSVLKSEANPQAVLEIVQQDYT